ncbi:MAG: hypothetical protein ABJA67_14115, partial [Chthonomonadales bacterium]
PMNVANTAIDSERFINRRAEIYWRLRERFQSGEISLPENRQMADELASLRYDIASNGKIKMESKDDMKKRGVGSPDIADMLAMLFDPFNEPLLETRELREWRGQPGPATKLIAEMELAIPA